ncbi:MAG: type transport system ATP-binding protein [Acidimicrobiaceae bacterium]|nr:type transport system ATP-binding protein [Acidimicrobiaceae bacterium]
MRKAPLLLAAAGLLAAVAPVAVRADDLPYASVQRASITSFDGTAIVYNLFLPPGAAAGSPVPVIMRTHGWGGSGEQTFSNTSTGGKLLKNGYAVLTWDERGFGQSGGDAWVDDPDHEVRDAQALVDQVLVPNDAIRKTAPGDPVIGMTGGSYAGGIQLALAAFDHRVDAIAPEITWNDLNRSLWQGDVIKLGWGELLYGSGLATAASGGATPSGTAGPQTGTYAPFIHESEVTGAAVGYPTGQMKGNFSPQGFKFYGADHTIAAPTLLIQGKTDTLFDLNEAWANFNQVKAAGTPAKLVAYCSGHAGCPSDFKDGALARGEADNAILNWFAKYLKGQAVATGAPVHYSLKDGTWHDAATFPTVANPGPATFTNLQGMGTVVNPGSPNPGENSGQAYGVAITDTSTAGEPGTMVVPVLDAAAADRQIVGIGHVSGTITGSGPGTNLIFKLVDVEDKRVLDYQAATLRVDGPFVLPTDRQLFSVDLVGVAELLPAGHHLALEVATTGLPHTTFRGPGQFNLNLAHIRVPVIG